MSDTMATIEETATTLLVWDWEVAPNYLKKLASSNDDKDYVVVARKSDNIPLVEKVVDTMAVCDYEWYEVGNYIVYITSHA